ncbi:MAG: hypothetical protein OXU20_19595 [Myxococcales bacterium]|nr:hypothetical protein [Myxococcales bacterium]MDD9965850.1 hypothetical protein [Myxococcales bacterium]
MTSDPGARFRCAARAVVWLGLLVYALPDSLFAQHQSFEGAPGPASGQAPDVHDRPAHGDLLCTDCHRLLESRSGGRDGVLLRAERCDECHRTTAPTAAPVPVPSSSGLPSRLRFSHVRHAKHTQQSGQCSGCHPAGPDGARQMPTMDGCLRCHDGAAAADRCGLCHVAKPDGRLRTRFHGGDRLTPRGPLLGMAHDRDWLVRHRWVGADHGTVCAACHTERDCESCHDGRRPPRRLHPNDFITLHPQQARRNASRCTSCHTVQRFCSECHARLGIALGAAPEVAPRARVHPPAGTWVGGPNQHGREARRDLVSCTSCHAESDCISCHGAPGIGLGANPHDRDIQRDCRSLLSQNPRPCRLCHGSTRGLCR